MQPVSYQFECADGPAATWKVRRVRLTEALSEPYRLELELWTEDSDTAAAKLLGASCLLSILRQSHVRRIRGIIHQVDIIETVVERVRVRVAVGPAFNLLRYQSNTRFWSDKTIPEILKEVLEPALRTYGRKFKSLLHEENFKPREYCVQYRETDFEFVTRLMHEEGIVYSFDHDEGVELLVLNDGTANAAELPIQPLNYVAKGLAVALDQSIHSLDWSCRLGTTGVVQRDWDWTQQPPISYNHDRWSADARGHNRVLYEHDDRRLHGDDGAARGRDKLERAVALAEFGHGTSDVIEFIPGRCFKLKGHPVFERDGEYVLVSVVHTGEAPEVATFDGGQQESPRYANEFRCIRPDVPYRGPTPPPRQRQYGPHTAIVVGPDSEEIHTDEHGRIRVIFHWDRVSPHDETASCWVRVAQTWAGLSWGTQFIPRIGMEVLVEFIDGDPDRPIVTGCVYNGLHRPPYTLPDHKTQSGIKTDSSPGGGGSNELRFEDAKGNEEVYLHAQKNLRERVENSHSTSVGGSQSNTVGGDQTESVTGKQTMTVEKNRTVTINGSQSVTINGGEANDGVTGSKLFINGDYKVDTTNTISVQAPTSITLTCGGSTLTMTPNQIRLSAGGGAFLVLDANALLQADGGAKTFLDANALLRANDAGTVFLDANAFITGSGGGQALFDANAFIKGNDGGTVLLTADAQMTGVNTASVSSPSTTLAGGSDTVVAGNGQVSITGGTIKLNS